MRSISWGAVASLLCMMLAFAAVLIEREALGIVFGLCSVSWALLSLADLPAQRPPDTKTTRRMTQERSE